MSIISTANDDQRKNDSAENGHQTEMLIQTNGCSTRCMACGGCRNNMGRCVIDEWMK